MDICLYNVVRGLSRIMHTELHFFLGVTISSDDLSYRQARKQRLCGVLLTPCRLQHSSTLSYLPVCRLLQRGFRRGAAAKERLQRVLNAAARVVSDTRKFDRGLVANYA